ncbi:YggS family pyridoxal phosphate-dependent enzyme [Thalassomonas haliotis]|uniref:Pyridoxal phosphate homeostasis protein n=1 Tax=Thalassomonas haliotis TaxID=485448 RepID=A0ABY7VAL0_9GAMM|nr:YggS family pyridoxal phosphate-dependent enzyme [Thalassomonas haliotis]WDE10668.1 YggS family pyridoxal phosphate-dependent enzyme [Thalassomonas haliotis]
MINIKDNLALIEQQISQSCQQANRTKETVELLAVSKTKPAALIEQAYRCGQRAFGESYVQEAVDKIARLKHLADICWHFIGPIQSNKTRPIAENFSWVHSVDRVKIAQRLNEGRSGQDTPLNVCLQVNISGEASKSGVTVADLPQLAEATANCPYLRLRGLMAIPEKSAPLSSYSKMLELFTRLQQQYPEFDTLSMGMSGDLQPAIANGSTMVRIGSAIFGSREQ